MILGAYEFKNGNKAEAIIYFDSDCHHGNATACEAGAASLLSMNQNDRARTQFLEPLCARPIGFAHLDSIAFYNSTCPAIRNGRSPASLDMTDPNELLQSYVSEQK